MNFTRRQLLQCFAAGGMIVAGKLWIPGERTIFIPSGRDFSREFNFLLDADNRVIAHMRRFDVDILNGVATLDFGQLHEEGTVEKIKTCSGAIIHFPKPLDVRPNDGIAIIASLHDHEINLGVVLDQEQTREARAVSKRL